MTDQPMIVKVLLSYFPDWEVPADKGREWVSCLCPFHGDTRPSASISFEHSAFTCFACGEKGDAISIIMRKEGMTYREAVEHAEELSPGSNAPVRGKSSRKSGRRVFGQPRTGGDPGISPGLRRRSSPWS